MSEREERTYLHSRNKHTSRRLNQRCSHTRIDFRRHTQIGGNASRNPAQLVREPGSLSCGNASGHNSSWRHGRMRAVASDQSHIQVHPYPRNAIRPVLQCWAEWRLNGSRELRAQSLEVFSEMAFEEVERVADFLPFFICGVGLRLEIRVFALRACWRVSGWLEAHGELGFLYVWHHAAEVGHLGRCLRGGIGLGLGLGRLLRSHGLGWLPAAAVSFHC